MQEKQATFRFSLQRFYDDKCVVNECIGHSYFEQNTHA